MNKEFLEKLLRTSSPSGYEDEALEVFKNECLSKKGTIIVEEDMMGNVGITTKSNLTMKNMSGDLSYVMISAHIDEIGFQVQHITESGLINIIQIGGPDLKVLAGAEVLIKGSIPGIIGKTPIHLEKRSERDEMKVEMKDFLVDIGAESKEEAQKLVEIGDYVTFSPNLKWLGENRISSKGLDDKIGIYIIAEVLKRCTDVPTLLVAALTQEEEGLRGAKAFSRSIFIDRSIDIDVTFATDEGREISVEEEGDIRLGKGPVIVCGPDKSLRIRELMKRVAKENNIPFQLVSSWSGGTNTSAIQEGTGSETALLSIPIRNMHTQVEVCDMRDVEWAIELLEKVIKSGEL